MTNPVATIETNMGTMKVELFKDKSPITVDNFIKLAEDGFYDEVIFHRIIEGFMIQTGDPTGTGTGGPGYTIKDEFHPTLKHDRTGVLSMANTGRANSGGSQFFVTLAPTPWLDNKHSIFGKVIEGKDVLNDIGNVEVDSSDRPLEEIKILSITIN